MNDIQILVFITAIFTGYGIFSAAEDIRDWYIRRRGADE
jgi:hypothetical protein